MKYNSTSFHFYLFFLWARLSDLSVDFDAQWIQTHRNVQAFWGQHDDRPHLWDQIPQSLPKGRIVRQFHAILCKNENVSIFKTDQFNQMNFWHKHDTAKNLDMGSRDILIIPKKDVWKIDTTSLADA